MKVSKLKVGEMYNAGKSIEILKNSILRRHIEYDRSKLKCKDLPIGASFVGMWNFSHLKRFSESNFLYLGYTREDWSLTFARNIIKKHHWFLFEGKKVIVDNYSIRFLKNIGD